MLRDKFSVEILRRISPNEPPFKDCCCSHWGSSPIFVLKSDFVLTLANSDTWIFMLKSAVVKSILLELMDKKWFFAPVCCSRVIRYQGNRYALPNAETLEKRDVI